MCFNFNRSTCDTAVNSGGMYDISKYKYFEHVLFDFLRILRDRQGNVLKTQLKQRGYIPRSEGIG